MRETIMFIISMLALAFVLQYSSPADATCNMKRPWKPTKIQIQDPNLHQFLTKVKLGGKK